MSNKNLQRSAAAGMFIATREGQKNSRGGQVAQGERTVKPPPLSGTVSRATAKSAVAEVISSRKK